MYDGRGTGKAEGEGGKLVCCEHQSEWKIAGCFFPLMMMLEQTPMHHPVPKPPALPCTAGPPCSRFRWLSSSRPQRT
eukprot:1138662-Pelagomonas_calceolata.AAC.5